MAGATAASARRWLRVLLPLPAGAIQVFWWVHESRWRRHDRLLTAGDSRKRGADDSSNSDVPTSAAGGKRQRTSSQRSDSSPQRCEGCLNLDTDAANHTWASPLCNFVCCCFSWVC
ncbi:uncharacterized protein LOC144119366 [Amblyomma americanum]